MVLVLAGGCGFVSEGGGEDVLAEATSDGKVEASGRTPALPWQVDVGWSACFVVGVCGGAVFLGASEVGAWA